MLTDVVRAKAQGLHIDFVYLKYSVKCLDTPFLNSLNCAAWFFLDDSVFLISCVFVDEGV